jgi:uncharacterized protein
MKICIVSDSHDHRAPLAQAVEEAIAQGAKAVLHCGDVVAPSTLHAIWKMDIPVHVIHGNNMGDTYHLSKLSHQTDNQISYHGQDARLELHGRKIFMVHYPHYAIAIAKTGEFDLVCNGHEHRARIEAIDNIMGGQTLRVDPGTVAGISGPATYILGDLETMTFTIRELNT